MVLQWILRLCSDYCPHIAHLRCPRVGTDVSLKLSRRHHTVGLRTSMARTLVELASVPYNALEAGQRTSANSKVGVGIEGSNRNRRPERK